MYTLPVRAQVHEGILVPPEDPMTPCMFIGLGTGIASVRAFLQEREVCGVSLERGCVIRRAGPNISIPVLSSQPITSCVWPGAGVFHFRGCK